MANKTIKVTLIRSIIGSKQVHRQSVRGLGLCRLNETVEIVDTPEIRGMIGKVAHLLKCQELPCA